MNLSVSLLPLASFVWGRGGLPPRPRTRGDHVILWVSSGRLLIQFPGHDLRLMAGALHYIPAGTAFSALPGADTLGHVALIPRGLAETCGATMPAAAMTAPVAEHGPQLITALRRLASAASPESGPMNLLASCLAALAPKHDAVMHSGRQTASRPDMRLIARFRALANERLSSTWTIADLAKELDCSSGALDQACLATHGCRVIEFINRLRLELAFDALRVGSETPAQIAARLGYVSNAHLARACVAATGRTPEVFRAQSG